MVIMIEKGKVKEKATIVDFAEFESFLTNNRRARRIMYARPNQLVAIENQTITLKNNEISTIGKGTDRLSIDFRNNPIEKVYKEWDAYGPHFSLYFKDKTIVDFDF